MTTTALVKKIARLQREKNDLDRTAGILQAHLQTQLDLEGSARIEAERLNLAIADARTRLVHARLFLDAQSLQLETCRQRVVESRFVQHSSKRAATLTHGVESKLQAAATQRRKAAEKVQAKSDHRLDLRRSVDVLANRVSLLQNVTTDAATAMVTMDHRSALFSSAVEQALL